MRKLTTSRRALLTATALGAVTAVGGGRALATGRPTARRSTGPVGIRRTTATAADVTAVPLGDPDGLYMRESIIVNRRGEVIGASGSGRPVVWSNGTLSEPILPAQGSAYLEWINDDGQFIGGFRDASADDKQFAVAWPEGIGGEGVILEPRAEFRNSRAYLINNNGQVAYTAIGVEDYTERCFLYDLNDGSRTEVLAPSTHPGDVRPRGFNDNGQFASSTRVPYVQSYVFYWENGVATDLTRFNSDEADHLNQSGQLLVAYATPDSLTSNRAYLWKDGVTTELDELGGDVELTFTRQSQNDAGEVIGISENSNGQRTPFVYTGGQMTVLPVPGNLEADPLGIAHSGDIAGRCTRSDPNDLNTNACVWRNGQFLDLGVPEGYGAAQARLATEQGDVIAFATSYDGNPAMTFLLTVN